VGQTQDFFFKEEKVGQITKRKRKISVEKSQIVEEIRIKLNNVRLILRIFQRIFR